MDGRAFLEVAKEPVLGTTEAHWRSAAGRAYYALMLESRDALQRWGFVVPPRDQVHAFVRLRFTFSPDPDIKAIGRALEDLGRLRNHADYQLGPSGRFVSPATVQQVVRRAEIHLARLDQVDADPHRRATVIAGIRAAFP